MSLLGPSVTTILQNKLWLFERMLFFSLYSTLHREDTSPAYFFQNLTEVI